MGRSRNRGGVHARNRGRGGANRRTASNRHRATRASAVRGARGGARRSGGRRSDWRLKEAIVPLGRFDNGISLYRFRYKGGDDTAYVGVMAQEVRDIAPDAVARGRDGYLRVDYARLGIPFMTWEEWVARNGTTQPVK